MLILFGSAALVLGIAPQIAIEAGIDEAIIWRYISASLVLIQLIAAVARSVQARNRHTTVSGLSGPGFPQIMMTSIVTATANIYYAVFWLYMVNLLLYLLASIAIFRQLVTIGGEKA